MAARMPSADLVHRNGLESALSVSMKARMSFSSCWVDVRTPRLIRLSVIRAKKRSTWLIQGHPSNYPRGRSYFAIRTRSPFGNRLPTGCVSLKVVGSP